MGQRGEEEERPPDEHLDQPRAGWLVLAGAARPGSRIHAVPASVAASVPVPARHLPLGFRWAP